ncbi:MAG: hypothetical protein A3F42_00880 [Gammaproteobacteria bacterium RIFCSPHIGHO2_12_FULL_37_34]|nr:MAG: hypothetical protein A3F42_00880 [Gammaproteobacteria bacterium RIFCSPHIGHO2_12_FULL_37_34]
MNKKCLTIQVSTLEQSLSKFRDIWNKVERGKRFTTPMEIVSFESAIMLMKTLSPRRLELLQVLHTLGKVSIRQLAKRLHRDYSNVYQDVKELNQITIILKDHAGKYYVPWDAIITNIPLCLERTAKHCNHPYYSSELSVVNKKK